MDLVRRLREFQLQINGESRRLYDIEQQAVVAAGGDKERISQVRTTYRQQTLQMHDRQRVEWGALRSEALITRMHLLNRLLPQPKVPLIALDQGMLAGVSPVVSVADYIEQLVRLLTDK